MAYMLTIQYKTINSLPTAYIRGGQTVYRGLPVDRGLYLMSTQIYMSPQY